MLSSVFRSVLFPALRAYRCPSARTITHTVPMATPTHTVQGVASGLSSIDDKQMTIDQEAILAPLRLAVKEQGDLVRQLKEDKRPKLEVTAAVAELKVRKKALEMKEKSLAPKEDRFDKNGLEDLMKRRFFVAPSYSIYGGVAGLYDYGPLGCTMKSNLLSLWRSHFVEEENMLEVECSILTPDNVLKASGHVERFSDLMVKDLTTGEFFRADHLLEEHLEKLLSDPKCPPEKTKEYREVITQVDNLTKSQLESKLMEHDVKAPVTGNPISTPVELNLMFGTSIGPSGQIASFLRPETAQGIFVNFKRLLEYNYGRLPFAAAQIGKAFRNEISPRSGILRVREFEMAEIEHFVNPEKRQTFPKFKNVSDRLMNFYTASNQMEGKPPQVLSMGDAVKLGLVANETLGYYLGRIHLFLVRAGIDPAHLRFRQHMGQEMAHYAKDCWDAECKTSYGWVECVGCADRSCYDLQHHSAVTKVDLCAKEVLQKPRLVDVVEIVPEKGVIGKKFRKDAKPLLEWFAQLKRNEVEKLESDLSEGQTEVTVDGKQFSVESNMVKFKKYEKEEHTVDVMPSVIEPSFGVGRIIYSILEHNFHVRDNDQQRVWLSLPPGIAPISCSVLPLSGNEQFDPFIRTIVTSLKKARITNKVDDSSGSIGRRYARTDEVGIPYGITVDFDTVSTSTVTLRERDSMRQVRIKIADIAETISSLVDSEMTWVDVEGKFPIFTGQESTQ